MLSSIILDFSRSATLCIAITLGRTLGAYYISETSGNV